MQLPIELLLVIVVGFVMAWAVGANDVANAMASTVGSKTLTIRSAVIIAAFFEAVGAMLASGQVTNMIRYGIIDVQVFTDQLAIFVIGMLSALMSAATWLLVATYHGWPVSTTHSIIGAVLGFGLVGVGYQHILWKSLLCIGLSWILTPICAVIMAYGVFCSISVLVLASDNPLKQANWLIPVCMALLVLVFSGVTIFQGLGTIGVYLDLWQQYVVVFCLAISTFLFGRKYTKKKLKKVKVANRDEQLQAVEKKFGVLSIMTAASMAYAQLK